MSTPLNTSSSFLTVHGNGSPSPLHLNKPYHHPHENYSISSTMVPSALVNSSVASLRNQNSPTSVAVDSPHWSRDSPLSFSTKTVDSPTKSPNGKSLTALNNNISASSLCDRIRRLMRVCTVPFSSVPHDLMPRGEFGPKGANVFVFHLPEHWNNHQLRRLFEPFGPLKSVKVLRSGDGKSKGFGFVCYLHPLSAAQAIVHMHGLQLGGKKLKVSSKADEEDELLNVVLKDAALLSCLKDELKPLIAASTTYTPPPVLPHQPISPASGVALLTEGILAPAPVEFRSVHPVLEQINVLELPVNLDKASLMHEKDNAQLLKEIEMLKNNKEFMLSRKVLYKLPPLTAHQLNVVIEDARFQAEHNTRGSKQNSLANSGSNQSIGVASLMSSSHQLNQSLSRSQNSQYFQQQQQQQQPLHTINATTPSQFNQHQQQLHQQHQYQMHHQHQQQHQFAQQQHQQHPRYAKNQRSNAQHQHQRQQHQQQHHNVNYMMISQQFAHQLHSSHSSSLHQSQMSLPTLDNGNRSISPTPTAASKNNHNNSNKANRAQHNDNNMVPTCVVLQPASLAQLPSLPTLPTLGNHQQMLTQSTPHTPMSHHYGTPTPTPFHSPFHGRHQPQQQQQQHIMPHYNVTSFTHQSQLNSLNMSTVSHGSATPIGLANREDDAVIDTMDNILMSGDEEEQMEECRHIIEFCLESSLDN